MCWKQYRAEQPEGKGVTEGRRRSRCPMCGTSWGGHRAGQGEASDPSVGAQTRHAAWRSRQPAHRNGDGLPHAGGVEMGADGGGTAMRCPRQKRSPCQPARLAPTPKFRAQQKKQLRRAESKHTSTTRGECAITPAPSPQPSLRSVTSHCP